MEATNKTGNNPTGAQFSADEAGANLSVRLERLREDNARLWKMIKDAQEASNAAGLIGMVGSRAWTGQIKKALSNVADDEPLPERRMK